MANLPEPVHHPGLVRAAVSPTALVVTAAGVGIGVADHSVILAVALGAGAWLGRMVVAAVGSARRRRQAPPRPAPLDPWSVPEPWRQLVSQAARAQSRFDEAVRDWEAGPMRDRLVSLQPQLYAGVEQVGMVAKRGAGLSGWATGTSGPNAAPGTTAQLSEQLRQVSAERARAGRQSPPREAALARTEEALAAQLRARRGAEDAARSVEDHLRVVVARLDETVTELLVIAASGGSGPGPDGDGDLSETFARIREEITALHRGLEVAQLPSPPSTP